MNAAGREFERAVGCAHFPTGALLCALFMAYLIGHIVFAFLRGTLPLCQAHKAQAIEPSRPAAFLVPQRRQYGFTPSVRVTPTHGPADVRGPLGL
jgi:hypothetical protein